MTNIEAIIEDLRPYPVRKSLAERKCSKYGLDPQAVSSDEKTIAKIVIEILVQMMTLNNVAQGGMSISFDTEKVEDYIEFLCGQNGLDSLDYVEKPSVTYLGDV